MEMHPCHQQLQRSPTIAKDTPPNFLSPTSICYLSTLRIVWFLFVDDPPPPNGRFLKKGPGYIRYIITLLICSPSSITRLSTTKECGIFLPLFGKHFLENFLCFNVFFVLVNKILAVILRRPIFQNG
jgi:hypothetical protein